MIGSRFTLNNYFKFFLSILIVLPVLLLLILQPDIGQTLLISSVWLSLIFVSGINIYIFNFLIIFSLLIIGYLIFYLPKFFYIKSRISAFFDTTSKEIINHRKQLMQLLMVVFLERVLEKEL